jgi:hypothetical protein
MALWFTQPLTEMSARNLPGRPSVSQLSGKCGSLNISQPYGPPWSVTEVALLLHFYFTTMMCLLLQIWLSCELFRLGPVNVTYCQILNK